MKKQVIVLISAIVSIFGLYWINAGKTSLKQTGEVAGREEVLNYTLPPGFIFSIWGVIYLGFIIYAIYGLTARGMRDPQMNKTAYPVAISLFLNLLWTVIVGAELWVWAYPLQWIMLVIAIIMLFRWDLNRKPLTATQKFMSIPFALYGGWLTVAMIPFTSDLLNRSSWNYEPFTRATWAIIIYVVAFLIVLLAWLRLKQPFFLLPLAWALYGLYTRFDGNVALTAIGLAGLLVLIFLIGLFRFYARSNADRMP